MTARTINEGGLRAPLADLIERVREHGFPTPGSPAYAAAIDQECERLIAKFPPTHQPHFTAAPRRPIAGEDVALRRAGVYRG